MEEEDQLGPLARRLADVLAGSWGSEGWRLATKQEVCELFERVGLESRFDCGAIGVNASFSEPGNRFPQRVGGLISMLGITTQPSSPPSYQDQQAEKGGVRSGPGTPAVGPLRASPT